eukprot:6335612-Amphidinium_carterae.1
MSLPSGLTANLVSLSTELHAQTYDETEDKEASNTGNPKLKKDISKHNYSHAKSATPQSWDMPQSSLPGGGTVTSGGPGTSVMSGAPYNGPTQMIQSRRELQVALPVRPVHILSLTRS